MPQSVRLAVASNTSENLDGHFGSAKRFLIYQVSQTEIRLIEIRDPQACEDAEDPNSARAQMLADCQLLYVQSIGGPAAAKVIRAGIHPVKFPLGGSVLASIERLQQTLQAPPPWLARIMGITPHALARFIVEEDEAA
jgi:nitrogen fixation protein NifX